MKNVAVLVCEDLDLHMPGAGDVTLDEYQIVPEGLLRLALGLGQSSLHLFRAGYDAHSLAPAPVNRLEQHRVSGLVGR